jgi:hypothetical protein
MEVVSWAVAFLAVNVPILTLLADRMLDVPAPQVIRWTWLPAGVALAAVVVRGAASPSGLAELVGWGALGGAVATVALDAVRLFGHHVLRAFPVDMPRVFGLLALGLGPRLQENVVAEMVKHLVGAEAGVRRTMLEERLRALAALPEPVRAAVVRGMRKGLEALLPEQREALVQTQLEVLASLPGDVRRSVLRAMDLAAAGAGEVYRQPRGLPRVPMDLAREFLSVAVPRTAAEAGVAWGNVLLVGYGWHLLNGLGFGMAYTLLFGRGDGWLALAWCLFIWAGMMVVMPIMMPTIRFPMPRFLMVPFLAHVVMAGPIGYFAGKASDLAHAASLLGAWSRAVP